jgi:hypothetical protein
MVDFVDCLYDRHEKDPEQDCIECWIWNPVTETLEPYLYETRREETQETD